MRIVFTGGGTGGHIFPIVALIREIKRIAEEDRILDLEFFYVGPDDEFGQELLRAEEVVMIRIMSGKMRRYFSIQNFFDFFKIIVGIFQAIWNMFLITPDVVFSKGGYGAFPTVIAAAFLRVPLMIHESDAIPGRVNKFSGRFATRIGIAFGEAAQYFPEGKTALVGIPIRKRLLGGDKEAAKEGLEIYSPLSVLSVMGASQGAQKLNDAMLAILKDLTDEYEILHQTGRKNEKDVVGEAEVILEFGHKERYHPFGFLDEVSLRNFYIVSDLIISRAGASSIFEIAAWGKPSIIIPLSTAAQNHQRENAYEYANEGATIVIEELNLTPHILLGEIRKVMADPALRKKMSEAAQRFARIDSAELIAREILKLGLH